MIGLISFFVLLSQSSTSPHVVHRSLLASVKENTFYVSEKAPLKQSVFANLPIGSIHPEGWLRNELKLEANGFTGHLTEISQYLQRKNNAWLSPQGLGIHGWEEVPYWLRGYGDLAYVLHDPAMIKEAKSWIEPIIESQRSDGWFGPRANLTAGDHGKPDVWPNMLALQCLESYYDYTHDQRVLKLMTRYFAWENALPDSDLLKSYWEYERAADNMASAMWLYNRTGQKSLLALVQKLHRCGANWVAGVANFHGVNFAQSFREPAELGLITHNAADFAATESDLDAMRQEYGAVPGGMYGADENARPGYSDPRQATETCAMVEMMMSDEYLLTKTSDAIWADRCEDVTFNDLPASMTANEKALHYLTAPNEATADAKSKAPGVENGGPMFLFNPFDHRCCQHNSGMGWPKFSENLWMATSGNGLAAVLYAPCSFSAKVGMGATASITESTEYPFRDKILFTIKTSRKDHFAIMMRVPGWCKNPELSLNGHPIKVVGSEPWIVLDRTWSGKNQLELTLPMPISVVKYPSQGGAVSVNRGPLSYSLKIGEKFTREGGTAEWPALSIEPTTPWNYGLDLSKSITAKLLSINPNQVQPFSLASAPIELVAYGRQIPEWGFDQYGLVATLQPSPAFTDQPDEKLTLVPMGAARLRISEFPVASSQETAHKWIAPQLPRASVPASASHCWSTDTVDALTNGMTPKKSGDQSIPRFTWYDHLGSNEWVELDFKKPTSVSSSSIYWFDDEGVGGQCRIPGNWDLVAWNGGQWQPVKLIGGTYDVQKDKFNKVTFEPVMTTKLRVEAQLQPGFSGGILQWKFH